MEKLDTPVSVDTAVGPVQCSLVAHNYSVQEIGDRRIVSTRQYCIQVGKEVRPVGQASSVDIIGENRDALGDDPRGSEILAKHREIDAARQSEIQESLQTRREALEKEIAETQARLEALRSQAK
jgi:hypothetical protein